METKKASRVTWKHIICCIVLLIAFVLTVGIQTDAEGHSDTAIASNDSEVVPLQFNTRELVNGLNIASLENEVKLAGPKEEVTVSSMLDSYITENALKFEFYASTFGVNVDDVLEDLHRRYENVDSFEQTNIGRLLNKQGVVKTYNSVEYGLVEYFYDYVEKHPNKVNKKRVPYTGNAEYVENLIIYFTNNVYTNVDTNVALSIGAAESGYYKVKFMLKANNVYGGMSSSGLIKYRNIEYGVLSYIRLLSKKYYGKGLTDINSIGRVYCPVLDNNNNKTASPHWIKLVSTAMKKYNKVKREIETKDLIVKKEKC